MTRSVPVFLKRDLEYIFGETALRLDDTSTINVIYLGVAEPGTLTSADSWQVKKLDQSSGLVITFADGDDKFNNVWDDRVSLSYS